jgi:hypothetical protein
MDYTNIPYSPQNNINYIQRNLKQKTILFIKGKRHLTNKQIYKIKVYKSIKNV